MSLTLGGFLRKEREKRGYTLEQVASATKIGLKILTSLEADQYGDLPALPFVRGFIKNYSKFLGLDPENVLQDFKGFLEQQSQLRPEKDRGHKGYAFERPEGEQSRKVLWAIMGGMFVFGSLVILVFKPSFKHRKHAHVEKLVASPLPTGSMTPLAVAPLALDTQQAQGLPAVLSSPSPLGTPALPVTLLPVAPLQSPSPTPSLIVPEIKFVAPTVPLVLAPVSPVSTVQPQPMVTPIVAAAPLPSMSPSPRVSTAAPVAAPTPQASSDLSKDPLQSGTDYSTQEIKYKILFKAYADAWIRYQCDEKQPMKFLLKKDKILVLRGKNNVKFQASNPDSIRFNINGAGYKTMSSSDKLFEYTKNATLVFPSEVSGKIKEIFNVTGQLPFTPPPEKMAEED